MKKIFYLTNDPERALGIEKLLPNYHIVSIDSSNITEQLVKNGVEVFSLESVLNRRNPIFRNSNKLLNHDKTLSYIRSMSKEDDQVYIMVFKIAPNIERSIKKLGYNSLNTTSKLNHQFEGKISQYKFLKGLPVKIPKGGICKLDQSRDIADDLGFPLVVQFDRGHTGEGTLFIEDKSELEKLIQKFPKREVRINEYLTGDSWTLNGVITRAGVGYGGLSKQLTGIKSLTDKLGATVGNDWSATPSLRKEEILQIESITNSVAHGMDTDGYKGLFGLDFIISDGEVFLIEINARQPASTGMHTKLMLKNREIPLMLLHIAEFLESDEEEYLRFINTTLSTDHDLDSLGEKIRSQNKNLHNSYNASQFIIRNDQAEKVTVVGEIKAGVYKDKFFVREGYSIDDLNEDCEYLLNCATEGRVVSSGSELARVQMMGGVTSTHGKLKNHFNDKIKLIKLSVSKGREDLKTESLPEEINAYVDRYLNLRVVDKNVSAPYFRNVKRVRAGLRSLLGKGTPEEIEEETLIYAKLRSFSLTESTTQQIREFMESQGIGIDCSGFVSHILAYWLSINGEPRLDSHLKFPKETLKRRVIRKFRYIENISADLLTNDQNSSIVQIKDIQPGDLIRLKGVKRGDHIAMIYEVRRSGDQVESFTYVHSSEYYDRDNGVKFGEVIITDPKKELKEQEWREIDPSSGRNFTLEGLIREYEDNGLRRPNFSELLK